MLFIRLFTSNRTSVRRALGVLLTLGLGFVALARPPVARAAEASLTIQREVVVSRVDLRLEAGADGERLTLRGGVVAEAPGRPALPRLTYLIALPQGMQIRGVGVGVLAAEALPGAHRLAMGGTERRSDGAIAAIAAESAAGDAGIVPAHSPPDADALAFAGPVGYQRGRAVAPVVVTPFRYDATTGHLELLTRLTLDIELEPAASPANSAEAPLLLMRRATTALTGGAPFQPTFAPSLSGSPVACVIITDDAQAAAWQPLADWKTQTGVPAVVRTVSWIRANYPNGVDTPETIRNFIRDAVQKWGTEWIVLGGDTPVIPIRYGHTNYYTPDDIPTDYYYQCLDGTWNADGDALFGEGYWSPTQIGDFCDLYPDVHLGRLPTNSAADAQIMVDKILAYSRNPPRTGYLTRALALGEVLFPATYHPGDAIQVDGAEICETALAYLTPTWSAVRLYEHCPAAPYPGCLYETKPVVVDSLNAGFGIVQHVGHGFTNTMSVGDQGLTLNNADASALHNGPRTFLLYAVNCTSSAVDYSCIAERFLLNPNGGAVASVGSTHLDFPFTSWNFQDEFYRLLFAQQWSEVGRCMDGSRLPFVPYAPFDNSYRWTQFSQILFGDPQMSIWTTEPADLAVTAPPTLAPGDPPPLVTVTIGGAPVDSARVCFQKSGDDYAFALTDSTGTVRVPFAPDSLGAYTVTVTARNAIPWTGSGLVVPPASTHFYVGAVTVDDDTLGASRGNGDGALDAGETVELFAALRTRGPATVDTARVTFSTAAPGLTFSPSVCRYAPPDSLGHAAPLDTVVLSIAGWLPDRTEARVNLAGHAGADTFADAITLRLHAPLLEWYGATATDTLGAPLGTTTPGVPFLLRARIRNHGSGATEHLRARLSSADPAFALADSVIAFGTLPGGLDALAAPGDSFVVTLADTTGLAARTRRLLVTLYDDRHPVTPLASLTLTPPAPLPAPANPVALGAPGSVALRCDPAVVPRLRGYNVYRAPAAAGPFSRINSYATENTAYYNDEGLTPYVVYHYRLTVQDSAGYEGPPSAVVSGSTTLPAEPGFPVATLGASNGSVTLANLDADAAIEVVGAGEEVYALNVDGTELVDGDGDPATMGALANSGRPGYWNAPAVADVDGDGSPDVAAVSWTGSVYLWSNTGALKPGFPRNVNPLNLAAPNPLGSVVLGDGDGDGSRELYFQVGANVWAFHADGTEVYNGDANAATIGLFKSTNVGFSYGTPALADITGDGHPELICGMRDGKIHVWPATSSAAELPGFPVTTGGNITSSPAVGDLDGDGHPEIVVGSSDNKVYALRWDGTTQPGWPQNIALQQDLDSSPALGDLTGDGRPDVVCASSSGRVYAWRHDGAPLPGFPAEIKDRQGAFVALRSSPALVDLDGDGTPEILVGDQIGRLFAFRANGQPVVGFPVQTENKIDGGPAAWDLDGDGLTEIVVQSFDQKIWVWETPWTFNPSASPWPMFHHDPRHTGNLAELIGATAGGGEGAPPPPVTLLGPNTPNPFARGTTIRFEVAAAPGGAERSTPVRLDIFGADGRALRRLLDRPLPAGRYTLDWDGRDDAGRRVSAGVYFCRLTSAGGTQSRKMVMVRGGR